MGRKSRHSSKTGDRSLYASRSKHTSNTSRDDNSEDDTMYNEVERHYNKHIDTNDDYLRLDASDNESDEDDGVTTKREGVFDLGIGSEDEDEPESSDSEEDDNAVESQPEESSDDDNSEEEDEDDTDVFNWGTKKHSYYHGDTADLEIGQDEDDAILEEEAGKEVQLARLENMEEGDFMLDVDRDDTGIKEENVVKKRAKRKEKSALSRKDKLKFMKSSHPELMPIVDHFRGELEDFVENTSVVGDALFKAEGGNEAEVSSAAYFHACEPKMHLI
jgi:U3 small nucleolar RNA-associated protein 3